MKVLKNISVLKKAINNISSLGFVPTMGGLHNGHISLIKESKKKCKKTIVSIYINPKQFNNKKDFSNYPRNLNKDLNLLKKINPDYVFLPTTKEMYKNNNKKKIILMKSEKILCAKMRKGHFEGVLDIMQRFIKLIKPKYIFMGEKDFQQLYLIKKFIKNRYKSKIYSCKTIRDKNYIALSTRNFLLSKKDLNIVGKISRILKNARQKIKETNSPFLYLNILKKKLVKKFKIKIDYLELCNDHNLQESNPKKKYRIMIAFHIKKVRLIDNF